MTGTFTYQELRDWELELSDGFVAWLADHDVALAFSQANRVWMVGPGSPGGPRPDIDVQAFDQPLGIVADGPDTVWLATRYQIWRLQNVLGPEGRTRDGHDRLYVPRTAHTTGFLGAQDLAVRADGSLLFTNTLFNCIATLSPSLSFEPQWIPPFVTEFTGEDRCHLTGLALREDQPAFATVLGVSDQPGGWRATDHRDGAVVDVVADAVVARGLCMPYSPRLHDGRLWVTSAGEGAFGYIDLERGRFETVVQLPAFLRGVAIVGRYAVVAASGSRSGELFSGLPVESAMLAAGGRWRQGLYVIDLDRGEIVESMTIIGAGYEITALTAIPGATSPKLVGPNSDEAQHCVAVGASS